MTMSSMMLVILSIMMMLIFWMMFVSNYKHFLLTLISMEFFMMNLIYLIFNLLIYLNLSIYLFMYVLIMMVCESVLGLSLIVIMVRYEGNDYLKVLVLLNW